MELSMWTCTKKSPWINCKIWVSYTCSWSLSSTAWPSKPKKHSNGLINQSLYWLFLELDIKWWDHSFNKKINESNDWLLKYVKIHFNFQAKEPKAIIKLDTLNVLFAPEKVGNLNGLQLSYEKDGLTRNLFVYAEDGKVVNSKSYYKIIWNFI